MSTSISSLFPLSDGTVIAITPSAPLTAETIGELLAYLSVYRAILEKRQRATAKEPAKPVPAEPPPAPGTEDAS